MPLKFAALRLITAPETEPVTLDEAKAQLRIRDFTDDDAYITMLITVAREWVEDYTSRALITQSWRAAYQGWPAGRTAGWFAGFTIQQWPLDRIIVIPRPPLVSVDSVKYINENDTLTVLDPAHYVVDLNETPGRIILKESSGVPALTRDAVNPVTIDFTCGYGAAGDVPASARQAMLLCVSNWYENRTPVTSGLANKVPLSAESRGNLRLRIRPI